MYPGLLWQYLSQYQQDSQYMCKTQNFMIHAVQHKNVFLQQQKLISSADVIISWNKSSGRLFLNISVMYTLSDFPVNLSQISTSIVSQYFMPPDKISFIGLPQRVF